jgi:hypothetical protein
MNRTWKRPRTVKCADGERICAQSPSHKEYRKWVVNKHFLYCWNLPPDLIEGNWYSGLPHIASVAWQQHTEERHFFLKSEVLLFRKEQETVHRTTGSCGTPCRAHYISVLKEIGRSLGRKETRRIVPDIPWRETRDPASCPLIKRSARGTNQIDLALPACMSALRLTLRMVFTLARQLCGSRAKH